MDELIAAATTVKEASGGDVMGAVIRGKELTQLSIP